MQPPAARESSFEAGRAFALTCKRTSKCRLHLLLYIFIHYYGRQDVLNGKDSVLPSAKHSSIPRRRQRPLLLMFFTSSTAFDLKPITEYITALLEQHTMPLPVEMFSNPNECAHGPTILVEEYGLNEVPCTCYWKYLQCCHTCSCCWGLFLAQVSLDLTQEGRAGTPGPQQAVPVGLIWHEHGGSHAV